MEVQHSMKRWGGLLVAGLLMIGGAACVAPASAAGLEAGGPGMWQQLIARVAAILGIPEQRLTDAIKQASSERVDEEARAGRLTPEQAQRLKERIAQGQVPFGHGVKPGGPRGGMAPGFGGPLDAASVLGLTPQQLMAELRGGKTLAQVGEAHGKTRAQLKEALLAKLKAAIDQAVAASKMTREQADARWREAQGRIDGLLDRPMTAGHPKGDGPRPFGPHPRPPAPGR